MIALSNKNLNSIITASRWKNMSSFKNYNLFKLFLNFLDLFENFYKISLTSKQINWLNIMENLSRNTPTGWMKSPEVCLKG